MSIVFLACLFSNPEEKDVWRKHDKTRTEDLSGDKVLEWPKPLIFMQKFVSTHIWWDIHLCVAKLKTEMHFHVQSAQALRYARVYPNSS